MSAISNITTIASAVSDGEGSGHLAVRKNDDAIVAVEETGAGPIPVRTLAAFLDAAVRSILPRRIVIGHPAPGSDYPGCAGAIARYGYELVGRTRNNSLYRLAHDQAA